MIASGSIHRNVYRFFKDYDPRKAMPRIVRSKTSPTVTVGPDPNRLISEKSKLLKSQIFKLA